MKQLVKIFGRFASKQAEGHQRRPARRPLRSETLEKRQLLAGDVLAAHNYTVPEDVNGDWRVTPLDALLVLNHLKRQSNPSLGESEQQLNHLVDVNGDNNVTPLDALLVLNRLSRGEAELDPMLELGLQPRTVDDAEFSASAFNPATRELTVGVGDVFYLEVDHLDLRPRLSREGVFALFADIMVAQPGYLEPVLTETQLIGVGSGLGAAARGEFDFHLEGAPGTVVTGAFDADTMGLRELADLIQSSVVDLTGYDSSDVTVVALPLVQGSDFFEFQVRYTNFDLAGVDLPNVMVTARLVDDASQPIVVPSAVRDIPPMIGGAINPLAIADNIDFHSRSYRGGSQYFGLNYFDGGYSESVGFLNLGGVGPLVTGIPQSDMNFNQWIDSFSIPVRLTQPVDQLQVSVRPTTEQAGGTTHGLENPGKGYGALFYNRNEPVPPDLIKVDLTNDPTNDQDGRGLLLLTAVGTGQTTINANNHTIAATENGGPYSIDLSTLVSTNSSTPPVYTITGLPNDGTYQLVGSVLQYTPAANFAGIDTLTYTASVGSVSDSGTITVNVAAAPVVTVTANNASLTAQENGPAVTLDLASSIVVTGSSVAPTITIPSQPGIGSVTVSGTVITFTPAAGQTGTGTFTYTATVNGVADSGTVNVTLTPAAVVVVTAADANLNATEDGPAVTLDLKTLVTVTGGSGVQTPVLSITTQPTKGTLTLVNGVATYTPTAGQTGADTFVYTATVGGVSDTGTISVQISPASTVTLTAADGAMNAAENGSSVSINALALVTTNSPNAPTLTITTTPTKGSVTVSNGEFIYTPAANQSGTDTFVYTASVAGASDSGVITVTITPAATVVVRAGNSSLSATQDGGTESLDLAPLVTVTGTPTNPARVYAITGQGTKGTATVNGSTLLYTPAAGQSGADTITYSVTVDGVVATGVISVNIAAAVVTVDARNGALTASQNGGAVTLNVASLVTVTGSTTTPAISIGTPPTRGTVTVNGTNLVYTPTAGQSGTDTFTYVATVNGVSDSATITATITPQAVTVVAADGSLNAAQNGPAVNLNVGALVTVTGSTATPTITISGQPTKGTVTVNGTTVVYTPATGQSGADSFVYTATVGGVSDTGRINVSISAAPVVVVADNGTLAAAENGGARTLNLASLVNVTGSSTAPVYTIVTAPTRGVATINGTTLTYTPSTDQSGNDTIVYRATVGGVSDTGTIAVTIAPVVAAPVARPDSVTGFSNSPITITSSQLVANDSAARPNTSGQPPVVSGAAAISGTTVGTVVYNAGTRTITYTPPAGFVGQTSFQYTITSEGQTATSTVNVTVQDFVPSVIGGAVFMDFPESYTNPQANGQWDANEPAVGGVIVRLTSAANSNVLGQDIDRITRTDAAGDYEFGNVAPGTYRVTFERPNTFRSGGAYHDSSSGVHADGEAFVVEIDSAGGVSHSVLDFTVTGYQGAAASAGTLLASDFLLLHPNSPYNQGRVDYGLATMIVGSTGQSSFDLSHGFDGVLFAEIAVGRSGSSALLTMIMEDGSVKTAMLSKADGDFRVSSNGAVVHVLKNVQHMSFINSPSDIVGQEYGSYRSAVDQILAGGL